ncbi:hypothetical protein CXB51_014801 [Gossypium anomalum]|uniref:Retrotransposon gag domain-containing protein n=1 Tax=Gossypium anomalum TaxID=47600 RepID=A0A8J6D2X1_9ROSI|nr:hypothetical protein CXB51_014801 [Gossypium anomalum]
MDENQENLLPPAIAADQVNQNQAPRTMYDYTKPNLTGTESSIVRPAIATNNFELKPNTIQMIQQFVHFDGLQDEDPNAHLANFLEFYDTFKINGISDDAIRLRLFPFSLRNKAKQWLNSLPRGSITTWEQMTEKILLKYFLPAKTTKLRNDISSFVQMDLETLYDAWERYNDLLQRYPYHGLPLWLQVQTFYNGVNPSTRQMIDAAAGGTIHNKTPEAAYEFIEEMSLNNYQWQVMRTKPTKTASVYNVDAVHPVMRCDSSGGGIHTEYQPFYPTTEEEQVHYMGNNNSRPQNNPFSNTYNTGWRNHPNFSWGGQGNQRPQILRNTETALKNQQELIQGLETQIEPKQETMVSNDKGEVNHNEKKTVSVEYKPRVPYPNTTRKDRSDVQFGKFLKLLKKLDINLPFIEALSQMPKAMKFLKELLSNKRKLDEASHVELNTVFSAILQSKLPNKLKDTGSFTIPCLIGSLDVNIVLVDLGASINVMPYKIFKQLGLGKPKQTKTIRFPRGIIEDVLVKIDKFIFLVDFVVLDIKEDSNTPLILGRPFLATARTIIDVGTGELTLRVGDETITLQAHNSGNTSKVEGGCINHSTKTDHMVQPTLQEMSSKDIHEPCSSNNKGPIHEERRLQIEELDKWRTHKPRTHHKPKLCQNELNTSPNQLKVGDKVLLDAADPRITTAKPNEEILLTVLSIFPIDTVEVIHPKFGTFKVNNTRLNPYFDEIDSRNEECKLLEPP